MSAKQTRFVVNRPVAVLMVFTAAVVFGFFSYQRLPLALMPELTYPTLTVRTEYPGAAPEEVENDISRPVEEALSVIGGLQKISSISRSGVSDVVMAFVWGTDMSEATQSTLEKLDLVFLPDEAERPLILHFDPSLDPILELSFSGTGAQFANEQGLRRLRRIAELQVKRALEPVKGVAAVRLRGGLEEEIHVMLDEESLRRTGTSIDEVIRRLSDENINLAGGTIKEGRAEYMVRTLNEFGRLDDIRDIIVRKEGDRTVRVRDLGHVSMAHKEREIVTKTGGAESVQIDIYKEADANIVDLARQIRAKLGPAPDLRSAEEKAKDPKENRSAEAMGQGRPGGSEAQGLADSLYQSEGALLEIVADRSIFIKNSIDEVRATAVWGGIFAIAILFLFLRNFKTTTIIAVSIPMSLIMTFAPLNLAGVSLNIMSLGGLALGIGMLVDSSIVVLESIYRCREEGDSILDGAVRGTEEVRGAVLASTLTSIAVFFPMVFVEGIAGQAFADLGMAVVTSLLASLLVALYFIPMLSARQGLEQSQRKRDRLWQFQSMARTYRAFCEAALWLRVLALPYFVLRLLIGQIFELIGMGILLLVFGITWILTRLVAPLLIILFRVLSYLPLKIMDLLMRSLGNGYPKVIRWAINNTGLILLLMIACFWVTWELGKDLQSELLPEVHQGEFTLEIALPVGTPIEQTRATLEPVESSILADVPGIKTLITTYGYDVTNAKRSDEGEHSARFKVILEPSQDNARAEDKVIAAMRAILGRIPDLDLRVVRPVLFSAETPIEVEIHGQDLKQLRGMADKATAVLADLPQLADVESTLKSGAPEIRIVYDREKVLRYNLNLNATAQLIKNKVKGEEATRFNMKDRRIPIMVRLSEHDRRTLEEIRRITVNPGGSHPILLESIAELSLDEGPSEIRRIDGRRVAVIQANLGQGSLSGAAQTIKERLFQLDWPEDMTFFVTGQNQEWARGRASLMLALFLSVFLVYVIMASQFESLIHPFVIMFTIPLAFLGSLIGLHLMELSLSVVVFLGMIMLAGIVVNNAIVLVDYINTLKMRGLELKEAVIQAGSVRLRPILMTTATTVLGLLPMAIGLGDGAEIRRPMAITVICGLVSSTVLTLVFVPAVYAALDRLMVKLFHRQEN